MNIKNFLRTPILNNIYEQLLVFANDYFCQQDLEKVVSIHLDFIIFEMNENGYFPKLILSFKMWEGPK